MPKTLQAAVEPWSDFPADATPRPLVLVGPWMIGFGGFEDHASAQAFEEGRLRFAPDAPGGALFAMARDEPAVPVVVDPGLRVARGKRVTRHFWTDRGTQQLPGWDLYLASGAGPVPIPEDVVAGRAWPRATWLATKCLWKTWATVTRTDGLTLDYHFLGERTDWADYPRCEVLETPSAVALAPVKVALPNPTSRATGMYRTVEVHLREPLGGRVLVNEDGVQMPFTIDGSDPWSDRRPLT